MHSLIIFYLKTQSKIRLGQLACVIRELIGDLIMGKAEENKLIKRTKLLDTALELFTTKGTSQTSVADITKAAGVGKGTFYLYFKDKESIEAMLISRYADEILTHALNALNRCKKIPETFEDKVVIIVADILSQLEKNKRYLRFIKKNLSWGVFRSAVVQLSEDDSFKSAAGLRSLLAQGKEEWNEPDLLLYSILELVSSTSYNIILQEDPVSMEVYRKYLKKYLKSIIEVHKKR